MMIPGQGRFNRIINLLRSKKAKKIFAQKPYDEGEWSNYKSFQVVSFSGKAHFYDQLLSILSLVKYLGVPGEWLVFSDGTYDSRDIESLERFSFVKVIDDPALLPQVPEDALSWMEKKFYYYSSVGVVWTTFFIDSDILFFPGFTAGTMEAIATNNWYLSEPEPHLDPYFLESGPVHYQQSNYVNSGFFILNSDIDWTPGKQYLRQLNLNGISLTHFSEQTAMEITFKQNALQALDPGKFCITTADHFTLNTSIDHAKLAMRHFVGPIRFRMWQVARKFNFFK